MSNKNKKKPAPAKVASVTTTELKDTVVDNQNAAEITTPELTEVFPSGDPATINDTPEAPGVSETPPVIETVDDTSKEGLDPSQETDGEIFGQIIADPNPWTYATETPEANKVVLCEIGSHLPVEYREYVKGQFDPLTGSYFTTKDGPYQILDVTRWMEVK